MQSLWDPWFPLDKVMETNMIGKVDEEKIAALGDVECCWVMRACGSWISRLAWSVERNTVGSSVDKQ